MSEQYNGPKFWHNSKLDVVVRNPEYDWGYDVAKTSVKKGFSMTAGYAKYLREKREQKQSEYIGNLRAKLEYQMKHFGEVDPMDYDEFCRACGIK